MKKLRTVLIGLGRIGWQYHLPELMGHEGFELTAVADIDKDRLAEAKAAYGVRGYTDAEGMILSEKPELTVIASPTHLHREQAIFAMEQGSDVFLDKPMARSLEEARDIQAAMAKTGRKLMVYQPHRAVAEAAAVRRIMDSGVLGRIFMMKRASSAYARRNDWQARKEYGGGMLNNYGAHFIDQLIYLSGCSEVRSLYCNTDAVATLGDADDVVKAVIRTDNGMTLDLDINMAAAWPVEPWMIMGSLGTAIFTKNDAGEPVFRAKYCIPEELAPLELSQSLAAQGRLYNADQPIPWHVKDFPVLAEEKVDFYERCYGYFACGEAPFVKVSETMMVMEILAACRECAEKGQ